MKINVSLLLDGKEAKRETIEIPSHKLEDLSEDEVEASIEMVVRSWADRMISIAWETEDEANDQ